jgi:hypothetical protein
VIRVLARAALVGLAASALAGCSAGPQSEIAAPLPGSSVETLPEQTYVAARPSTFAFAGELTQGGWIKGTVPAGTYKLAIDGEPVAFGGDGSFFAAFDRDAAPTALLVAGLRSGEQVTRTLTIVPLRYARSRPMPKAGGRTSSGQPRDGCRGDSVRNASTAESRAPITLALMWRAPPERRSWRQQMAW